MVQEAQMITFKRYLLENSENIEEGKVGDKLLKSALVGSALFAGYGFGKHHGYFGNTQEPNTQEVQKVENSPTQTQPEIKREIQQKPQTQSVKITPEQQAHDNFHSGLQKKYGNEYSTILNAAKRNGIQETDHDKLAMLFAIRKTENGRHGKQFGVLHTRAYAKPGENEQQSLDRQAGWASSILNKRESEWNSMSSRDQGQYKGFHHYLQSKYAPHGAGNDPKGLNKNWLNNFTTHYTENIGYKQ
jgi:hypothetical protein